MVDFALRRRMMVDTQVRPSDVTEFPIIDAMLTIPREEFVPQTLREAAYSGEHLPLGGGRVILDPRILAKMIDALDITSSDLVLDLGCGMGYSTAVLARLAEAVVAVEPDASYATEAQAALSSNGVDNATVNEGTLIEGSARYAPYDVIILQGGVETIPEALLDQLAEGGRIAAIFMEGALGTCRMGRKSGGRISWRYSFNGTAPVLPGFTTKRAFSL